MRYLITGTTESGNHRSHNEDAILMGESVCTEGNRQSHIYPPFMCAVCDGVGGENAGEIASRLTAELLSLSVYKNAAELKSRIFEIHDKLVSVGERKPDVFNMQTTLCLAAIDKNDTPYCINIGDSRAYVIKNNKVNQITTDQSLAQYLRETGKAKKFDIDLKDYKNVIISSIGNPKQYPMVDLFPLGEKLGENDMIILCSDGVSDHLSKDDLLNIMTSDADMLSKQQTLIDKALENGSRDNLSVVCITPDANQ